MDKKFCIQTQSGEEFDPKTGEITAIKIDDIAHALSHMCRYAGHCNRMYSVAEHSVLVSRIIRKLYPDNIMARWAGLLHDATEAYVCDLPTQLKILLPGYQEIEDKLAKKIATQFGIAWTPTIKAIVKLGDLTALSTEARLLFENVESWDTIKQYEPESGLLASDFPQFSQIAKRAFKDEYETIKAELEQLQANAAAAGSRSK